MSNFTYLLHSANLVPQALVTSANASTVYPAANVALLPISQPFRTTEGKIKDQKIQISFAVAQTVDTIALVNHNLTSSATITVKGGTLPDPDGSDYTTTITHDDNIAWKILSSSESWRYWSIEIDDKTNWEGFLQVGYVVLGVATAQAHGFATNWNVIRTPHVRFVDNEFSQPMVGRSISQGSTVALIVHGLTDAQRVTLDDWLLSLQMQRDPMIFWPDTAETEAYFGRLNTQHVINRQISGLSRVLGVEFKADGIDTRIIENPLFWYEPA